MKIIEVIPHRLSYPVKHPYRNCRPEWVEARPATLFEIKTDNGLTGWGEGGGVPPQSYIETHVIGKDPFDCAVIYDNLSRHSHASACGIEIALWDLIGKALDKPVYKLLGGAHRASVPA